MRFNGIQDATLEKIGVTVRIDLQFEDNKKAKQAYDALVEITQRAGGFQLRLRTGDKIVEH